jgi:hypothetical protein
MIKEDFMLLEEYFLEQLEQGKKLELWVQTMSQAKHMIYM